MSGHEDMIDLCSGAPREVIDLCSPDRPIGARKRARFDVNIPSFDLVSDSGSSEEIGEVVVTAAAPGPADQRVPSGEGRCNFFPAEGESIESFLHRVKPSRCRVPCDWIQVHAPERPGAREDRARLEVGADYERVLNRIKDVIRKKNRVTGVEKSEAVDEILRLAKESGETTGKWMLFPSTEKVDAAWSAIARAVVAGELDISAKVSPMPDESGKHLICVYCRDFTDRRKVR